MSITSITKELNISRQSYYTNLLTIENLNEEITYLYLKHLKARYGHIIKLTSPKEYLISLVKAIIHSYESKKVYERIKINNPPALKTNIKNYWNIIVYNSFKIFNIEKFAQNDLLNEQNSSFFDITLTFLELNLLHNSKETINFLNHLK